MKHRLQKELASYSKWRKGVLIVSPLEILLITVVLGLVIFTISICTKFTKGPLAIIALKNYFNDLHIKLKEPLTINAEAERAELEKLLNKVKGSCDRKVISSNMDLKAMFDRACKQIKAVTTDKEIGNRSSWQQFKDTTFGFDEFYFSKSL